MEEYFAEGTIPEQHLITALHEAIREDRIFPVLFASGLTNVAPTICSISSRSICLLPWSATPLTLKAAAAAVAAGGGPDSGETTIRKMADSEPCALFVFKTMSDPFAGRISFFKVISGVVKNDATVENYTRKGQERLSHLSVMQGRKAVEVLELHAGDLGAVAKLREHADRRHAWAKGRRDPGGDAPVPEPAMTYAIEPKSRAPTRTSWPPPSTS